MRKGSGFRVNGLWFGILFLLSVIAGIVVLINKPVAEDVNPMKEMQSLWKGVKEGYPPNTIAVLNIFSPIYFESGEGGFLVAREGAASWLQKLKRVEDDPNVVGVILRMESPGGTIAATQEIYNAVKRLKAKKKVVTVSMCDLAASGAYYIACAADYIVANPGTLTGSIGVIISSPNLTELFQKLGISYNVIKSGGNKDMLSPYKKMTKEEEEILKSVVMDSYSQFLKAVSEGRNISLDDLKPIADGRIFTGVQALNNGLVDELGDFEDTVAITAKRANIVGKPNVVEIKHPALSFFDTLSAAVGVLSGKTLNLQINGFPRQSYSPVLYLYAY